MRRTPRARPFLIVSLLVCGACSDNTDNAGTDELLERLFDLDKEQNEIECGCPDSDHTCPPRNRTAIEVRCYKSVAAKHAGAIRPELECETRKLAAENACLRTADCNDIDAWEACYDEGEDCDDTVTEGLEHERAACEDSQSDAAMVAAGNDGGPAGTSGTAGSSGASGAAGSNGSAGRAGSTAAGSSGRAATAGTTGNSGASGSAGASGTSSPMPEPGSEGCAMADWPESGSFMLDVAGAERGYVVTLPADYDAETRYSLVFAWHGRGGTATQLARGANGGYYGLPNRAGGAAIFVAGQALPAGAAEDPTWPNTDGGDVAFVRALLDWLRSNYCIADDRVFSVGMSDGGIMSNTLGCEMGDAFRGIAAMSASGPAQSTACVGQVAVWLSHGNADAVMDFSGGEASRDHWMLANHCDGTTEPVAPEPCVAFSSCEDGHPVHFCAFDGGHLVPAFAADAIWSFFSGL